MSEIARDINLGETNIDSHEKEQTIKEQQDKEILALLNDVENLSQADTLLLFNSLAEKNPAFQAELEKFQNTNSQRVVEMLKATNENKEKETTTIQEYFDIDNDSFNNLNSALSETGLDINELLNGYKTYLETNLEGLSKESKDKIIKSISIKVMSLSAEIAEIKSSSKNPEELKNNRWIINEKLLNELGFINKQLLPSIEAKQKIESGIQIPDKYSDKFISKSGEYTQGFMPTNANYVDVNYKIGELDELLKAPVNKNGDFDEGLISTQNILNTENKQEKGLLTDLGVEELDLSLLNETDKKIEENAMLYFMAMIGVQIGVETLGGIIGTIAGGGVDLYDMVSKDEVLLKVLQSINLVPEEYKMDKTLLDNILAGIGIIPGATQIIKGGKLAKFMEKVDIKVFDNAVGEIKNRLGIEKSNKIEKITEFTTEEIERLRDANNTLARKLDEKEKIAIIKAHNTGERLTDGTYSLGDLREKVKILQESGISNIEIKILFDKNICGSEFPKYKSLYEDPRYEFLNKPEYSKAKEVLGDLNYSDIIGEGMNGIILKHPNDKKVLKIAKPNSDKLEIELENHRKFYRFLKNIKIELQGTPEGKLLEKLKIPKVNAIDIKAGIYEMEKVEGKAYKTIVLLEYHKDKLKDLPLGFFDNTSDNEIDVILKERGLKTYPKNSSESHDMWKEQDDIDFMVDIERAGDNIIRDEVKPITKILRDRGYNHNDEHWGNFMRTNDGTIYMIDFGRSKVPKSEK
ncbi:MAG: hypothetical protein PHS49_00515 [Candidatus Gracilibacteria bacterium]|nr:hypothetical protein [Candidatus Gracilibacteria bacterium]